jgi:hypothetical protein
VVRGKDGGGERRKEKGGRRQEVRGTRCWVTRMVGSGGAKVRDRSFLA